MRAIRSAYASLEGVASVKEGECVVDMLLNEARKVGSRKRKWTRDLLNSRLGEAPTSDALMEFVREERDITAYALDPTFNVLTL